MGINAFLDNVRRTLRLRHYSLRTEEVYRHRIKEFISFHGKRHPQTLGVEEIRRYLTYLAVEQTVAASTQNVARSATAKSSSARGTRTCEEKPERQEASL